MEMEFGGAGDVRFERIGKAGVITLTRPKALNALNLTIVASMRRALRVWEADADVALVIVRGEGRAFCAGGDILDVYKAGRDGRVMTGFFQEEYSLNAHIARFPKPYVALIDGIVMGGGCGISVHGSHRVYGENAVLAMPEVGIGFFPDVGGGHFLPRLKGKSGMWLGLTGNRVKQGDALAIGAATHAVPSAALEAIFSRLCETGDADAAIAPHAVTPPPLTPAGDFAAMDRLFAADTLEGIMQALENEAASGGAFARTCLDTMATRSPTSMAVTFRELREGAGLTMDDNMRMEYRVVNRMLTGHDFYEGIRAVLVDRDNKPVWEPATLDGITPAAIDAYFAPLEAPELDLS